MMPMTSAPSFRPLSSPSAGRRTLRTMSAPLSASSALWAMAAPAASSSASEMLAFSCAGLHDDVRAEVLVLLDHLGRDRRARFNGICLGENGDPHATSLSFGHKARGLRIRGRGLHHVLSAVDGEG